MRNPITSFINKLWSSDKKTTAMDEMMSNQFLSLAGDDFSAMQGFIDEAYKNGLFYRIIGTNAVYHEELLKREWYISTDVSGLFANVITRIHYNQSLSELLDNRNIIEKVLKNTNPESKSEGKTSN